MSNAAPLSNDQLEVLYALQNDFKYFCKTCIKIEGAEPGSVYDFELNDAQLYLLAEIIRMMAEVGMVRIIIIKGRQQGISTFIEIFLLWLALFNSNTKICIVSHEADSAASLFQKAEFAWENLPPGIRPDKEAGSRGKEMVWVNKSRYMVVTAGSDESGRSRTAHHDHQSERAFFKHPEIVDAGVGQIVRDAPGTYRFRESTGNGQNHMMHEANNGVAGKGIWRTVFIPWHWEKSYRFKPEKDFERTDEEEELARIHGIDDWQLQWRRNKIVELKSLRKFRQEYPFTLAEAFQASGNSFFDTDLVTRARKSTLCSTYGPVILGCDPARKGDRAVIVLRQGREIKHVWRYDTTIQEMDNERLSGILSGLIDKYNVDKCFIDWGKGDGAIDRLWARGYRKIVEGVHFGGGADEPKLYLNKRAEMFFNVRDWLSDGEVSIPDDDDIAADMASLPEDIPTSNGRAKFPTKEEIKKEYGRSPDILDAIGLTFAYPVRATDKETVDFIEKKYEGESSRSGLTTRQRVLHDGDDVDQWRDVTSRLDISRRVR